MTRITAFIVAFIAALLLLSGAVSARAQSDASAERYFHRAAQQYIAENVQEATRLVDEGLARHPNDPKLRALRKKLRQQQSESDANDGDQQQGESNAQGQGESPQQQEQQQGQQRGDQGPRQRPSGQRGAQSPRDDASQNEQGDPPSSQDAPSAAEQRPDASASRRPQGLTRKQAARILRALEGQEKQLLREVQERASTKNDVEKDW